MKTEQIEYKEPAIIKLRREINELQDARLAAKLSDKAIFTEAGKRAVLRRKKPTGGARPGAGRPRKAVAVTEVWNS